MAAALMRRLQSTRRHVPLEHADDYLLAFKAVQLAVRAVGGRAWLFQGVHHEDQFLEFIEWTEPGVAPTEDEAVTGALGHLDAFAPATHIEEWEEAT